MGGRCGAAALLDWGQRLNFNSTAFPGVVRDREGSKRSDPQTSLTSTQGCRLTPQRPLKELRCSLCLLLIVQERREDWDGFPGHPDEGIDTEPATDGGMGQHRRHLEVEVQQKSYVEV
ncbi:hypothetical protein CRENBAI_003748 [Crenichthys baileyi]|uniref:Uncharacterized protein n=1 Tax=Crenichthys baileyi TaxID=28760 RepID=A0AAV9RNE8_9TELE